MGLGDELMAAGRAEMHSRKKLAGAPVHILDRHGRPRWHELWFGNPHIAAPTGEAAGQLVDGPGARPYIVDIQPDRFVWSMNYHAIRCTLPIMRMDLAWEELLRRTPDVAGMAPGAILVEPNLKRTATRNKQWPWSHWQAFAALARDAGIQLVQVGSGTSRRELPYAHQVHTATPFEALAVLDRCRAYVGHEGFFHHAAAALVKPAVVIFGGYISPEVTGYAGHRNLFTGGEACGRRIACPHCEVAMAAITPQQVLLNLREIANV